MQEFLIENKTSGDGTLGFLSFFEAGNNKEFPFPIKRIYYTYGVPVQTMRGKHAHKELQQILWCPSGSIEVILDDGFEQKNFLLDSPEKALLVLKGYWHDMIWKEKNSVLCVAASDYYEEEDYIRDYDEFLNYVEKGYWKNGN